MNFANMLQNIQDAQGITRQELAVFLGASESSLCEWIKGDVKPKADAAVNIYRHHKAALKILRQREKARFS